MQIRKFKGEEMSGILRTIHRELGPEAVILLTRETQAKDQRGLSRRMIEVTAATEGLQTQERPVEKQVEKVNVTEKKEAPFETQLVTAIQGDIYQELQSIKGQLSKLNEPKSEPEAKQNGKMHETWLEMKTVLKVLSETRYEDPFFSDHERLFELFQKLRANGIDSEMAKSLCQGVKAHLTSMDLQVPEKLSQALKEVLSSTVEVKGGFESLSALSLSDRPRALALVGLTGVGKTTTLAKIAARQVQENRKVRLIAYDPFESGDEARLMRFAQDFGIPAEGVRSLSQLKDIVSNCSGRDLILIDTVGCNPLDPNQLKNLNGLSNEEMPIETHLVLSANTKASDMSDTIDGFSILPIDSLLFTKIDETRRYGPLFSILARKRKPLSFLTTGRRVPQDIEAATPQLFSELVLQE